MLVHVRYYCVYWYIKAGIDWYRSRGATKLHLGRGEISIKGLDLSVTDPEVGKPLVVMYFNCRGSDVRGR